MSDPAQPPRIEPRWPVVLAILAVLALLALLPERLQLLPVWLPYAAALMVLAPMAAVALAGGSPRWLRVERAVTLLFFAATASASLANLANLIGAMVRRPEDVSGVQLLASSIGVWVTNVVVFSLLYWQVDRGGPEARLANASPRPDWLFPQESAPAEDIPPGWRPKFADYLFLGYCTATAFSPTDVLPLTTRAKMLMMLESAISLTTILVVAARAINILGS